MKQLKWVGTSKEDFMAFPDDIVDDLGYQLHRVQEGEMPLDWKVIKGVPPGVKEIRVNEDGNTYRVIYITKFQDSIYVLHAFQKKDQKTRKSDIKTIKDRLKTIQQGR